MTKYGMVIDLRKCIGCHSCTVSCKFENNVPYNVFRTWVRVWEKGDWNKLVDKNGKEQFIPQVALSYLPRLCNHCDDPPCVEVCPVEATFKREDGLVLIDDDECIGCKYCIQACPYDMRFINPKTQTADKCTFCVHRLEDDLLPACVTSCVGGARIFGDLDDPQSEVAQLVNRESVKPLYPEYGTEPNVFYIDLDEEPLEPEAE